MHDYLNPSETERNKILYYEKLFNIHTIAADNDLNQNMSRGIHYQYEPTDYEFLEFLFQKYRFREDDHLIDFGCGLGRVMFMASYFGCKKVSGYELDHVKVEHFNENRRQYANSQKDNDTVFQIFEEDASNASIPTDSNLFFFFEPFHLKVFIKVVSNIMQSLREYPRKASIYIYLPQKVYIDYLESVEGFKRVDITFDLEIEKYCTYAVYERL